MKTTHRLLFVDNDCDFIRSVKPSLEEQGFDVLVCHSAIEAIQLVEYEFPDIVVSEVMIEKHDSGFTLAKQVKADPRFRNIPFILLTAVKEKTGFTFDYEKDGYWMKVDDYIEKPIPIPDLISKINLFLNVEANASS